MKYITFFVLAFVLIAGNVSVSCTKEDETQTVRISMEHPDKAAEAAGMILSEIGNSLQGLSVQAAGNTGSAMIYRIRNAACEPASQIGAYTSLDAAKKECVPGYCIFDQNNTLVYAN